MTEDNPDIALYMPLMRELAARSTFIIELGSGDGNGSLRALSDGLRRSGASPLDKLMISVELREDRPKERPADPWWKLIHGDAADLNTVSAALSIAWTQDDYDAGRGQRLADLIFIDTAHTFQQLQRELTIWRRFARPSTIWLFHDTWMDGVLNPMNVAIGEFVSRDLDLIFDDTRKKCHGLGVVSDAEGLQVISDIELRF